MTSLLMRMATVLGCALLVLLLGVAGFFETPELKLFDLRLRIRGERPADPAIVIVTMDEQTRAALGADWQKRRLFHGEMARALTYFGARTVAYDVFFEGEHDDDADVAASFREAGNVYLACCFSFQEIGTVRDSMDARDIDTILEENPGIGLEECAVKLGRDPGPLASKFDHEVALRRLRETSLPDEQNRLTSIWNAAEAHPPATELAQAARGVGFTQLDPDEDGRGIDRDGVARKYPLLMRYDGRIYPSLSLAVYLDYQGLSWSDVTIDPGRAIVIRRAKDAGGSLVIPVDREGQAVIDWAGGWSSGKVFRRLSYGAVLAAYSLAVNGMDPEIPPEDLASLKNAVVFVGETTLDTSDLHATPFESWYPMVGFQAGGLSGLLRGDFLRRAGRWTEAAILLALVLLLGFVVPRMRPLWASLLVVALLAGVGLALQWLLVARSLWVGLMVPVGGAALSHVSLLLVGFEMERRDKRRVRKAFGHYVAPAVVDQVLRDPSHIRLGGERREVSVLFSDIRDFTTVSESLEPEALVALINEYLTAMTRVVYRHHGTLDKFVGDAIMAVYGAPLDQPAHAEMACRTAVEMMEALHELCAKWEKEGRSPINIGIGINTGPAIAGNVGSDERMDYTVMGDTVNVASRLEGANKEFHTNIIVSEATFRKVEHLAEARSLGTITVKGRAREIQVYELRGMRGI